MPLMVLGYHYHVPAFKEQNTLWTHGGQGLFLDSLAPYCEKIVCFLYSPRENEKALCNYPVQSPNIEWVDIGPHTSVPARLIRSYQITSLIKHWSKDLDVMLLRGPSPLLPYFARHVPEVPKALLLVASYTQGLDAIRQPFWRKSLIRFWAHWNETEQLSVARKALTFVNSHKLYEDLKPFVPQLVETRTTTIRREDFFYREDTCQTPPYRLLFSGRISFEKGIYEVLDSLALLREQGYECLLEMVGAPESEEELEKIFQYARQKNVDSQVQYLGFKRAGPELLQVYRRADLFILASRDSEGFPRTIWEAFSQGLPVVTSNVGSIPYYLQNEVHALIIPPKNPQEFTRAIERLLTSPSLRRQLIQNAYGLAEQNTLEVRAKEMMEQIETWLKTNRSQAE